MPMVRANGIMSPYIRDIMPDDMKQCEYIQAEKGFIGTIVKVVYSTYEVPEKDDNGLVLYDADGLQIPRKNAKGEIVYNTTAYVKWDNGAITSFNGRHALAQLASLTGDYVKNDVATTVKDCDPCKVKLIMIKEKFGGKDFDKFAFEPLD